MLFDLNEKQREVVLDDSRYLMVQAGPGTGKTKTLAYKIAYLIKEKGISPSSILAMAFSRKAANELRERVLTLCSNNLQKNDEFMIMTFHGFCVKILRDYSSEDFRIIGENEKKKILKEIKFTGKNSEILKKISRIKNSKKFDGELKNPVVKMVFDAYQTFMATNRYLDYDDIILCTIKLLKKNTNILKLICNKYVHFFIDEFQDTNDLQMELIKLFSKDIRQIFFIGDANQSIYSFRGITSPPFEAIKLFFPQVKEFILIENYRSGQKILDLSSEFLQIDSLRSSKNIDANIVLTNFENEYAEARFIAKEIDKLVGGGSFLSAYEHNSAVSLDSNYCYSDIAVLLRTTSQLRFYSEMLSKLGVPYCTYKDNFLYRAEIKDFLAILSLYLNKDDKLAHKRLKYRKFNVKECINIANKVNINLYKNISTLIHTILKNSELFIRFANDPVRLASLNEFVFFAGKFDQLQEKNLLVSLRNFLDYCDNSDQEEQIMDKLNYVQLLTIHGSKGLEFSVIFLPQLVEGRLPLDDTKNENNSFLDEEKRIFYTALTRAKEQIFLSYSRNIGKKIVNKSPFLANLSSDLFFVQSKERKHRKCVDIPSNKEKNIGQLSFF